VEFVTNERKHHCNSSENAKSTLGERERESERESKRERERERERAVYDTVSRTKIETREQTSRKQRYMSTTQYKEKINEHNPVASKDK